MRESGETYLETILVLHNRTGNVRSIDVATELGYTKPSVSRAMSILRKDGYITFGQRGQILLTDIGRQKAEQIYERHRYITRFLMYTLKIDLDLASQDACRIEHIISDEVFERIKDYVEAQRKEN
ncbi:metal-dependent transcriptional regulator [Eubacteriales bacterium OttesenSCG-928-N14]|nr:metal-dependent transcriptional regulator [Eubacteriales bacterium OttesenSCG-928-N14]